MKKLVLVLAALAVVGAFVALLLSETGGSDAGAPSGAPQPGVAGAEVPAADKSRDPVHKARARPAADATSNLLAVAGVVKGADGGAIAGALVEAFVLPAADDVSDEERVQREFLTKAFGRSTADRLAGKGKTLRDAVTTGDNSRMGDMMQEGMSLGMELLTDEGGLEALGGMMRMGRDLLVDDDGRWPSAGSSTTAADGTFRLEGLSAGRLELRAKAPGHVRAKQRAAAGDEKVSIRLVRGARLGGVVTCEKEPVVGATIVIKGATTTSVAGGRFEFDAAHAPTETFLVSAQGCVSQGRTVALTVAGPNKDVDVALDPAGSAAGHVAAVGGGPIAGARVTAAGSGNMFMEMMGMAGSGGRFDLPPSPVLTDANGAFSMEGIPTGAQKLRIEADGYLGTAVSIDVQKRQISAVEAMLVRESVLAGTVRDAKGAGVPGAKVRVEVPPRDAAMGMVSSMMGGSFRSGVADSNGVFEVHGLTEGSRKVRVEAAKFLTLEDNVEIPAEAVATKDFTVREGMKLAGTVAGPDGKPFAAAKIYVSGKPAAGGMSGLAAMFGGVKKDATCVSAGDGTWSAEGLPEGPYEVKATADGYLEGVEKGIDAGRTDVALKLGAAATIRGRVLSVADMKPVAGATVARRSTDAAAGRGGRGARNPFAAMLGGGAGATVTTDKDGAFELKGLEPGGWELTGTMRGFADSEAVKVTCSAGEPLEGVELMLPAGVQVTGRVVEKSTGEAVAGAVVWASKADGANPFAGMAASDVMGGEPQAPPNTINARTDSGGRFVLEGLVPGKVNIEVRVADHAPATMPGASAPATDLLVQVTIGGAVEGRVTGAGGGPVSGAQIMLMRGGMRQGARQAKSDSSGDYRIERLPAGTYQIMMMDPANPMLPSGMASVAVTDGGVVRHDFTKAAGGRQVGGSVGKDGKPLANAPVMLMGGSGGLKMSSTDKDGHFNFEGLEAGEYTVMVQTSFVGGGSTSRKVTVGSDGKVEDVRLELSSAKVEGDVTDVETGKGVAGAQVSLTEPAGRVASGEDVLGTYRGQAITDERGHFVVNDVQTGTFTLKVSAAGYPSASVERVASGTRNVGVQLRRGVELLVTVVGPDNQPVANATVLTMDASGNAALVFDNTMSQITRADGIARLRLAPGRYTLSITATNLLPAKAEVDTSAGATIVRLDAGATLELTALSADGVTPLAGARVTLFDAAGTEIKRGLTMDSFMGDGDRTNAEGKWSRTGLAAGDVKVVVTDAAGLSGSAGTSLEMNRSRHVDVVVK